MTLLANYTVYYRFKGNTFASKIDKSQMDGAAVHFKAVIQILLVHCFSHWGWGVLYLFCDKVLCVITKFAIISLRNRGLIGLL